MKIWHLSDTHGFHRSVEPPENPHAIEAAIFSGDAGDKKKPAFNESEVRDFLDWFADTFPHPHRKVFVAGNHDTSVERGLVGRDEFRKRGIEYLNCEGVSVGGLFVWGSPYTPAFKNWAFMKGRQKLGKVWENVPNVTDVLVTHGPPKGVLDAAYEGSKEGEMVCRHVGDQGLMTAVKRVRPKLHLFGHVHDQERVSNAGLMEINGLAGTKFSNASVLMDGNFEEYGPLHAGHILEL